MSLSLCLRGYSAAWAVISCEIPPMSVRGENKAKQLWVLPQHQTGSISEPLLISVHHIVHICSHNSGPCYWAGICFVLLNAFRWQLEASSSKRHGCAMTGAARLVKAKHCR